MNKFNFVRNGVSRLPPGFRFQPTDEELVFQYLKCKVFSCPLPASIIPDVNVCNYDPWDLPGVSNWQERYFFSLKEAKYRNGNRMNRTTNSGYWKATGSDKKIPSPRSTGIAGIRKTLVFYQGKSPNGSKTDWIMHEYRLVNAQNTASNNSTQNYANEIGDWVICRIFVKKRESEEKSGHVHMQQAGMNVEPRVFDLMMVHDIHSCTSSSCSSSSAIAGEVSSSVWDHEATSGYTDF